MKVDTWAKVLEVASVTEHRTPDEQRALLESALWVDNERARFLWKSTPVLPYLTMLIDATYIDDDRFIDDDQLFDDEAGTPRKRTVELTAAQRALLAKLDAKFMPCTKCGVVKGEHAVKCLEVDLREWSQAQDAEARRVQAEAVEGATDSRQG